MTEPSHELRQDSSSSELRPQLEALAQRLEVINLKLERNNLEAQRQPPKDKEKDQKWWSTAIQFLGLPALVIAMLFQYRQASEIPGNKAKTAAETSKIATEELKARAELQEILNRLEEKKSASNPAFAKEIQQSLPQLQQAIQRLQQLNQQQSAGMSSILIAKYFVIWALLIGLGLVFQIVNHFWYAAISSGISLLYSSPDDRPPPKWRRRLARRLNVVQPMISPVPSILHWAVEVVIFAALVIPFFDSIARLLGSPVTLESIIASAKHLDIGEAVRKAQSLMTH
jgi:hypothetical protein